MMALICSVFFLSGASALVFEALWFHQAGLALGSSIWASSLVLAGFMGGLALGNGLVGAAGARIRRPIRVYAALEGMIAVAGVAMVLLLPVLTPLLAPALRALLDQPWLLNPFRFGVAFALLLIPSTAMGATLPVLVDALYRRDPDYARVLGRLYGWNTLGAVAGVVAAELWLIGWLGIRGSAGVAAACNLAAASLIVLGARSLDSAPPTPSAPPTRVNGRAAWLLAAAFGSGALLLAFEVVWFRFLTLFIHATSVAFALMLAVVLAGIGLGGIAASHSRNRDTSALRGIPALALLAGPLAVATYALFGLWLDRAGPGISGSPLIITALSAALMFPIAFVSGMLFTRMGTALHQEIGGESRSAGYLTLCNSLGAMLGPLAAAFVLLPTLGVERSTWGLAAGYGGVAFCAWMAGRRPEAGRETTWLRAAAVALLAALVLFPFGQMRARYLAIPIDEFAAREGAEPTAIREGLTETVVYLRKPLLGGSAYHRLVTNSFSMTSTTLKAQRYMRLFAYLPAAVHPDPRRALLISYGLGQTASALLKIPELERLDVVDTSRDILELSDLVFESAPHPLRDPRTHVHVEDGRHFLQVTDARFDLITGEPPPPQLAGVVNLYTREYFALARERLAAGGLMSYWLPVHSLAVTESQAIVRAFCDVFPDCTLWHGSWLDWTLLGSRDAGGPVSAAHFERLWSDADAEADLRRIAVETPSQLGALFMAGPTALAEFARGVPPLVDDRPKRLAPHLDARAGRLAGRVYQGMMSEPAVARERFAASPALAPLWPEALRREPADFGVQQEVNRYYFSQRGPMPARVVAAHRRLEALRTLPLWELGSDDVSADLAEAALARGDADPAAHFHVGARALVDGDFRAAATHFASAAPVDADALAHLRVYALLRAGDLDPARALATEAGLEARRQNPDRAYWRLVTKLGL